MVIFTPSKDAPACSSLLSASLEAASLDAASEEVSAAVVSVIFCPEEHPAAVVAAIAIAIERAANLLNFITNPPYF